jgi:hypothetical protein
LKDLVKKKEVVLWSLALYQSNLLVQFYNLKNKTTKPKINTNHCLNHRKSLMSADTIQKMESFTGADKEKLKQAHNNHRQHTKEHAKSKKNDWRTSWQTWKK